MIAKEIFRRTALFAATASVCSASIILDTDETTLTAGGTTHTVEGNTATFPVATKYSSDTISGTDRTVVIAPTPPNNDFYLNIGAGAIGTGIDVATYRYVQVFYTLGQDWTGSTHQLRLDIHQQTTQNEVRIRHCERSA